MTCISRYIHNAQATTQPPSSWFFFHQRVLHTFPTGSVLSRLQTLLSRLFMPLFMLPLYLLSLQLILLPQRQKVRQKVRLSVYVT